MLEEKTSVYDFYDTKFSDTKLVNAVSGMQQRFRARWTGTHLDDLSTDFMDSIAKRSARYGTEIDVSCSTADEECERELESEKELEKEEARVFAKQCPAEETTWDFAAAVDAPEPTALNTSLTPLNDYMANFSGGLQNILWPTTVLCTDNFIKAIVSADQVTHEDHLR